MSHHVSMIGAAFAGNKGAAAMLISSIESVLSIDSEATLTLFSMYPEEDIKACRYTQVEIIPSKPWQLGITINLLALLYRFIPPARPLLRRKSRAIKSLSKSSILLDQMGVSFSDGREFYLLYNTAALLPAFLLKIPVIKCAQALGPFRNPVNKTVSRLFLPRVDKIITRGRNTHNQCVELGLSNLIYGADSAFLLHDAKISAMSLSVGKTTRGIIGVVPSNVLKKRIDLRNPETYEKLMVDVIETLQNLDYEVVLIPHSARSSTSTQNNDLPLARSIFKLLRKNECVTFYDEDRTISQLRADIAACNVLITGRFHAMVSSLALSVPPIVMGWGHKYEEVLEMFDLTENSIPYQKCNLDVIIDKVEDVFFRAEIQRQAIEANLSKVRELAKVQDKIFSLYLNSKN